MALASSASISSETTIVPSSAAMDAPDSNGRIQYVANAPIDQFDPGNYAVRFVVRQGAEVAEEDLSINLEP